MLTLESILTKLNDYKDFNASKDFIEWSKSYGSDYQRAYDECPRGDWLLLFIYKCNPSKPWSNERKVITEICLDIADLVKEYRPKEHADEITHNLDIVRKWCEGEASKEEAEKTISELSKIRNAAYDDYITFAAAYAINAAVYAVNTVNAIANASFVITSAATSTANVSYIISYDITKTDYIANVFREEMHKKCANKIREKLPICPLYKE